MARAYRKAKELNEDVKDIVYQERMPRFTKAFNRMFEGLTYSRIENVNGKKSIFFRKNGIDIPINNLSSGEKQVVYRGCFLLKDVNATNGAFVFIDKPEYFKCNSIEAVQDAFQIEFPNDEQPIIYLEGRTDEKYFNKALEIYGCDVNFKFKWIGYIDEKGQEANTGKDALNKAVSFLRSANSKVKSVCLYDCDTNKPLKELNNVITYSIPKFENSAGIKIGIENALVLDDIDVEPYKKQRKEVDGYGIEKLIPDFQKMKFCDDICNLDSKQLKNIFSNLKEIINYIIKLIGE